MVEEARWLEDANDLDRGDDEEEDNETLKTQITDNTAEEYEVIMIRNTRKTVPSSHQEY